MVLVGTETKGRKHVDWEIYSSMYDGKKNKRSGVVAVMLPTTNCGTITVAHEGEKERVYPESTGWYAIKTRADFESHYPDMPERIIDNLVKEGAKVSVTTWGTIAVHPSRLRLLIDLAHRDKEANEYALGRRMRRSNS